MNKKKLVAILYFIKTYLTVLPELFYKFTIVVVLEPKKTQTIVHQLLNNKDLSVVDKRIQTIELTDYFKNTTIDISLIGKYYISKSSETRNLKELASLAFLVNITNPSFIFEFGTFIGRTTSLFAINSDSNCKIFTMDLPQDKVSHNIGEEYKNKSYSNRIVQYNSDSRFFNFNELTEKFDFVWVDACHDYEFVKADTINALKICKVGGIIAWHDYRPTAYWSGVTRYLRELKNNYSQLRHIKGTTIVWFYMV